MSPNEISLPLLFMADSAELIPILFCIVMNTVIYLPMFSIIFTPAVGVLWMPVAGIAAAGVYKRNHTGIYADTAFRHGIKYSVISIFLWMYLIRRIQEKTFSRNAIRAAYALSYAQWGIWYIMYFILDLNDPRRREIAEIPFTSIEVRLYIFAAVVSSLTLIVSFVRLYRARWDPKLATREPEDGAWFAVLPASVYVMPFLWSNLWMAWLMVLWLYNTTQVFGEPETHPAWPIVFYLFVVATASIIWMLWSPMKLAAQRAKHMIGKQTES